MHKCPRCKYLDDIFFTGRLNHPGINAFNKLLKDDNEHIAPGKDLSKSKEFRAVVAGLAFEEVAERRGLITTSVEPKAERKKAHQPQPQPEPQEPAGPTNPTESEEEFEMDNHDIFKNGKVEEQYRQESPKPKQSSLYTDEYTKEEQAIYDQAIHQFGHSPLEARQNIIKRRQDKLKEPDWRDQEGGHVVKKKIRSK